jgi:hypothetical protein
MLFSVSRRPACFSALTGKAGGFQERSPMLTDGSLNSSSFSPALLVSSRDELCTGVYSCSWGEWGFFLAGISSFL